MPDFLAAAADILKQQVQLRIPSDLGDLRWPSPDIAEIKHWQGTEKVPAGLLADTRPKPTVRIQLEGKDLPPGGPPGQVEYLGRGHGKGEIGEGNGDGNAPITPGGILVCLPRLHTSESWASSDKLLYARDCFVGPRLWPRPFMSTSRPQPSRVGREITR